jgi:hypothetical protein
MIITEFLVEGALRNGNFAMGSYLIYQGLHKDPWYYGFIVKGEPKYLYYFTEDTILSTSDGVVKRYDQIDVLKLQLNKTALFFEQDRDSDLVYRGFLSSKGVKWHTYNYDLAL